MKNPPADVFIQELGSFCKARRGRISDLAQALEVPSERVSNWLHGRYTPRPETRSLMESWLQAARALEKADLEAQALRTRSLVNSLRQKIN
jgi:ribosome-binding protein aMBF1 (putative translation factor)